MNKWLQTLMQKLDAPPAAIVMVVALFAIVLLFMLLWIAMRRGQRVSLGGAKGFVFEAPPPAPQTQKAQK